MVIGDVQHKNLSGRKYHQPVSSIYTLEKFMPGKSTNDYSNYLLAGGALT